MVWPRLTIYGYYLLGLEYGQVSAFFLCSFAHVGAMLFSFWFSFLMIK